MYYLNQTPYPFPVPGGLTRTTPPRWLAAGGGRTYEWHDGRLQALASIALPSGVSYAGRWAIPVLVNGRRTVITGGLWRVGAPSIVWFWPLVVFLLCGLAVWRVRSPELDARVARAFGIAALVSLVVACAGRELHGRPGVNPFQYTELVLIVLFAGSKFRALLLRRAGFFSISADRRRCDLAGSRPAADAHQRLRARRPAGGRRASRHGRLSGLRHRAGATGPAPRRSRRARRPNSPPASQTP